jgi:hypothetical protein
VTPKASRATAAAPPAAPCEPSDPLAPVAAEGDRSPACAAIEARMPGSPDVPGAAATGGREEPQGCLQPLGDQPEALSGAEGRKAWQAAISARNADQRRGRARPRYSADPYAKGTRGARKLPPPKDGA